jgi:glycerophosphoryl diester phosphodiesterase
MPQNKFKSHPFLTPFPVVCAHRGDSAYYPENTLAAFMSAAELGADCIESDVHLTADGQCVLWHDSTVDRMTSGTGEISDYTLKELQQIDAAYSFTLPDQAGYPFRGQEITIPSLAETLEALPAMRFNLDLKGTSLQLAEKFVEVVDQYQAQDRILGASFHYRQLRRLRKLAPALVTSFASPEVHALIVLQRTGLLKYIFPFRGLTLQVPETHGNTRIVTPQLIKRLHAHGISVQVWTINAADDMQRLLDMGVDGIVTDDPRLLQKVLKSREIQENL